MTYTGRRPGLVLLLGVGLVLAAALAPAGLAGRPIPAASWLIWAGVFGAALALLRTTGWSVAEAARRVLWLLPFVVILAVPAGLTAEPGTRVAVAVALGTRALAAAVAAAALAGFLAPEGLVRGLRQLPVPARLVDITEAALSSVTIVMRQAGHMLRAREARRPGFGAWSSLVAHPVETIRGFGRLVATLLLRSLERAEAVDRARRARGGIDP